MDIDIDDEEEEDDDEDEEEVRMHAAAGGWLLRISVLEFRGGTKTTMGFGLAPMLLLCGCCPKALATRVDSFEGC